ncbi:DnaD domain-containing protein [Streptococcus halichoeri]|uniref:DnaD domain-containing protein n=1 Tax=Streptococcus halichoeri TaxID=254785 RepID=UPI00135B9E05|nr:DnaD domain-containing protein [Streptococcus halichoeri]
MSYLEHYKSGNLVFPSALLFHYKDLFNNPDDFLVWQFFYLQNTTSKEEIVPSQIAKALGKTVADINKAIASLSQQQLLDMKTIELAGEIETIFDATPALAKLDEVIAKAKQPHASDTDVATPINPLRSLVTDFEQELGRLLSPFELEDLQKTVSEDKVDPDLIREALREAVFNGKTNWKYIQAILRNWRKEGITNLRQVKEKQQERETKNQQVAVSDDFLAAMNLWSDDE